MFTTRIGSYVRHRCTTVPYKAGQLFVHALQNHFSITALQCQLLPDASIIACSTQAPLLRPGGWALGDKHHMSGCAAERDAARCECMNEVRLGRASWASVQRRTQSACWAAAWGTRSPGSCRPTAPCSAGARPPCWPPDPQTAACARTKQAVFLAAAQSVMLRARAHAAACLLGQSLTRVSAADV
jgi:hypothetical protein